MNETQKLIFKSAFTGFIIYGLSGLFIAFVLEYFASARHNLHGLRGILLVYVPLILSPIGAAFGFIAAFFIREFRNTVKLLIIAFFIVSLILIKLLGIPVISCYL